MQIIKKLNYDFTKPWYNRDSKNVFVISTFIREWAHDYLMGPITGHGSWPYWCVNHNTKVLVMMLDSGMFYFTSAAAIRQILEVLLWDIYVQTW